MTDCLAVVTRFLDENHKLQTALLDLPPRKGSHSSENIAQGLVDRHHYRYLQRLPNYWLLYDGQCSKLRHMNSRAGESVPDDRT
jgi:hypothetical protein